MLVYCCSLGGPQSYSSPVVVFFDRGHPCFRNFNSTVPVDIIRVKSYVNRLFDPSCVPVRVTINKLYLIPKRVVSGVVGMLCNGGSLGVCESDVPVVFFDSILHRSSSLADQKAQQQENCTTADRRGTNSTPACIVAVK